MQSLLKDVIADYEPLLEEKHFVIKNEVKEEQVFTDRRGLQFMLGQIISNVIKYSTDNPMLTISTQHTTREIILSITDNGSGVKSYDLPYIFQKGFTGDSANNRNKATGMGLYLTKKMADDLNLKLDVQSDNSFFEYQYDFQYKPQANFCVRKYQMNGGGALEKENGCYARSATSGTGLRCAPIRCRENYLSA